METEEEVRQRGKNGGTELLLETLLGGGRGAVGLGEGHDAVRSLQVRLQGLLIGRLQRLKQMLRFPAELTVETPITPVGEGERKQKVFLH